MVIQRAFRRSSGLTHKRIGRSGCSGVQARKYEVAIKKIGGKNGCHPQILSGATAGAKKYSWCRPPSTALAYTATSSRKRCRDLELKL